MARKITTLKALRARYPRGSFVDFRSPDAHPGCELKVWRHEFDSLGRPTVGGYLYTYDVDDDGNAINRRGVVGSWPGAGVYVDWLTEDEITAAA